jgi:hypothetical protein
MSTLTLPQVLLVIVCVSLVVAAVATAWLWKFGWKLEFGLVIGEELLVYQSRHFTLGMCKRKAAQLKAYYVSAFSGATAVAPDGTRTHLDL